jgi:hypothetical protein
MTTPTRHNIETLEDLVNVVTGDNIDTLLQDLTHFFQSVVILKGSGQTHVIPKDFVWIDDGQNKATINISAGDKSIEFNIDGGVEQ